MFDLKEFVIPPDEFDEYLKKHKSASGVIYEANKEQFEKAIRDGKIKQTNSTSSRIRVEDETVSESYTFRWEWIGEKQ